MTIVSMFEMRDYHPLNNSYNNNYNYNNNNNNSCNNSNNSNNNDLKVKLKILEAEILFYHDKATISENDINTLNEKIKVVNQEIKKGKQNKSIINCARYITSVQEGLCQLKIKDDSFNKLEYPLDKVNEKFNEIQNQQLSDYFNKEIINNKTNFCVEYNKLEISKLNTLTVPCKKNISQLKKNIYITAIIALIAIISFQDIILLIWLICYFFNH